MPVKGGTIMKYTLVLDKDREEEVTVVAHQKSALTDAIERLVAEDGVELIGYKDREMMRLELSEIVRFAVDDNKVYAVTESERLQLKCRLYQLEERLPSHFVKIHQSCIANLKKVRRFDASLSGALKVIFRNGDVEFVSRRQLKTVKERLGVK